MIGVFITLLLVVLLLNKLLFHYSGKSLTYRTSTDKKVYEIGETIKVMPVIENRKPLTLPFLRVDEYYDPGFSTEVNSYSLVLLPYQRVRRTYQLSAVRRGLYYVEAASLKLGDLLGFYESYREIPLKVPVVILPEKRPLKKLVMPVRSVQGPLSVRRWILEDPLMIRGIREYTGNESQRYIHWPSTLKHDRLMVKQFDFTAEKSVLLFLNMESTKPFWKNTDTEALEEAIVIMRAVMEELTREKIPFSFASNGYNEGGGQRGFYFPPGLSKNNLQKYNEILGKMGKVIAMPLEESLKVFTRNRQAYQTFVLITPHLLPEYLAPLSAFTKTFGRSVVFSVGGKNLERLPKDLEIYRREDTNGTATSGNS